MIKKTDRTDGRDASLAQRDLDIALTRRRRCKVHSANQPWKRKRRMEEGKGRGIANDSCTAPISPLKFTRRTDGGVVFASASMQQGRKAEAAWESLRGAGDIYDLRKDRKEEEEEKDPFHLSLSLLEDDSAPGTIWYTFLHAEGV